MFLRDVFICSLGAYGGPEAHMGVFVDQMVTKKNYLTEEELVELMALCSILPGPTSTQMIVSIGYPVWNGGLPQVSIPRIFHSCIDLRVAGAT
jgi:chromate transport protein ChrA